MVNIIQAIILGIVQGITEWLPISSSGHLPIFHKFMDIKSSVFFDMILHLGTILVVIFYYRDEIFKIIKSVIRLDFKDEYFKLFFFLFVGSIPIGIFRFFVSGYIDGISSNLFYVGFALIFTGLVLIGTKKKKEKKDLTLLSSILIGIVQALAVFPGVSRSGMTISTGMYLGIKKEKVAMFSFLLSIPAILGANVYLFIKNGVGSEPLSSMVLGFLSSAIIGYITLKFLVKIINNDGFHKFSYYCFALGILILIISFF